jgi:erythromycin esterase-like protein
MEKKLVTTDTAVPAILRSLQPLHGMKSDYDETLALIGDAHFVLLGEATHGTHEFYRARAELTRRLIEEKGFYAVAVEADWPDAYRVNRFVRGAGIDANAAQALDDFTRFPLWMWRNREMVDFIEWLHAHNANSGTARRVGFYGLDLYSLYRSIGRVIAYLDEVDPEAAVRARNRYRCFDHRTAEGQRYGYEANLGIRRDCEDEALAQLMALRNQSTAYVEHDGVTAADDYFHAEQNARLVRNAEQYYRAMFGSRTNTWNLRDRHMAETLDALTQHLSRTLGTPARIVVWEHNSHIGDARATERADVDEINVGQLVRSKYGADARLIGFTTYDGTVAAAYEWDGPVSRRRVQAALAGSYEALFHSIGGANFFLPLIAGEPKDALREARLERAIGVVYAPETERLSHYFMARLSEQFDAVFHFDRTRAVTPLDLVGTWARTLEEVPETYPFGE